VDIYVEKLISIFLLFSITILCYTLILPVIDIKKIKIWK